MPDRVYGDGVCDDGQDWDGSETSESDCIGKEVGVEGIDGENGVGSLFAESGGELVLHLVEQDWRCESDGKCVNEMIDAGPDVWKVIDNSKVIGPGRLVSCAHGLRERVVDGRGHTEASFEGGLEAFGGGVVSLPVGGRQDQSVFRHEFTFADGCGGMVSGG